MIVCVFSVENQHLAATFSRPRENRHWKPLGEIMHHHVTEKEKVREPSCWLNAEELSERAELLAQL